MANIIVTEKESGDVVGFSRSLDLIDRLNQVRPTINPLERDEEELNFARFVISPLAQGYGTTLGNAIRRVLISSITGSAVSYIKFDKTLHEYSTTPGIQEDGIELLLNFKALQVHLKGSDNYAVLTLDHQGVGDVQASHIKPNPDVEFLDPDQHLATITDPKAHIKVEIGVGRGVGYVPSERHKVAELNPKWGDVSRPPLGVILMDSKFSPVLRANYIVENTRVGQDTELDKLTVEIKTNGSISPHDALKEAANILTSYYNLFVEFPRDSDSYEFSVESPAQAEGILAQPVDILDLPIRPANCLRKMGISTIGELIKTPESDLLKIRNFGEKSLREIKEKLEPMGLELPSGSTRRRRGGSGKQKD
jgi:DNA-directed RNA polymerase subunit alpha